MKIETIKANTDFSNSVVPENNILLFVGENENNEPVLKYKDSAGEFHTFTVSPPSSSDSSGAQESCDYYKCSSVDTTNHTWAGYRAVLSNGVYTFENTVTTGLTYDNVTPVVGNLYVDGTLVSVKSLYNGIPTNGLDFYIPFDDDLNEQIHKLSANNTNTTYFSLQRDPQVGGYLRCTKDSGNLDDYVEYQNSQSLLDYGYNDFSISFWLRAPYWTTYAQHIILSKKEGDLSSGVVLYKDGSYNKIDARVAYQNNFFTADGVNSNSWVNYVFIRSSGTGYWYKNGILDNSGTCDDDASCSINLFIGRCDAWNTSAAYFDLKAVRVYNRALSASEIARLLSEFPSAPPSN